MMGSVYGLAVAFCLTKCERWDEYNGADATAIILFILELRAIWLIRYFIFNLSGISLATDCYWQLS